LFSNILVKRGGTIDFDSNLEENDIKRYVKITNLLKIALLLGIYLERIMNKMIFKK